MTAREVHLTVPALAERLGVSADVIYAMNSRGTGPARIRVGKGVRYRIADVEAWEATRVVQPTARIRQAQAALPAA